MENEIKSVSDIIAEISKKDKKRQVFILTNLINQLKNTRIEANSNYEDCQLLILVEQIIILATLS